MIISLIIEFIISSVLAIVTSFMSGFLTSFLFYMVYKVFLLAGFSLEHWLPFVHNLSYWELFYFFTLSMVVKNLLTSPKLEINIKKMINKETN